VVVFRRWCARCGYGVRAFHCVNFKRRHDATLPLECYHPFTEMYGWAGLVLVLVLVLEYWRCCAGAFAGDGAGVGADCMGEQLQTREERTEVFPTQDFSLPPQRCRR
jgi:hypothetical protein